MRKILVKIIQLLDGTPAVYGKRQSGQSVVELALVTPLLIVLLAGLVEIGWFANNYINLLDVTRAGARRGAVLQDQKSPLFWENQYSYVPKTVLQDAVADGRLSSSDYIIDYTSVDDTEDARFWYRWFPDDVTLAGNYGDLPCDEDYRARTFYTEVICTMITTMDPLELNYENGVDDIIVSAFAMQQVQDGSLLAPYPGRAIDYDGPQVVVAGRYPTNANECNLYPSAGGPVRSQTVPILDQYRDPFDIGGNADERDIVGTTAGSVFTELSGYDDLAGSNDLAEKQVGFVLFGNHAIEGTYCIGSEWTMREIMDLMNLGTYDQASLNSAPSQGVVIAEIFWEHEMLLKLPLLSPVYTAVGDPDGRMVISIWAAFPLSSVEPHIQFP